MQIISEWDATQYFRTLTAQNKLAQQHGFDFVPVPSIAAAFALAEARTKSVAHVAFCETSDGQMREGRSGGYFRHKVYTVFIMLRANIKSEADKKAKLDICRNIRDQFYSRLITEQDELEAATSYIFQQSIQERDTPTFTLDGSVATFFQLEFDIPVDLRYNPEQWTT